MILKRKNTQAKNLSVFVFITSNYSLPASRRGQSADTKYRFYSIYPDRKYDIKLYFVGGLIVKSKRLPLEGKLSPSGD